MLLSQWLHFFYLVLCYLCCSFQFEGTLRQRNNSKINKKILYILEKIKIKTKNSVSLKTIGGVLDCLKCMFFIVLADCIFGKKNLIDLTAIIVLLAHYYPFFGFRKNNSKNFIAIMLSGILLDPITGASMLVAFVFALKCFKYKSIATLSSAFVSIIKTIVHICVFSNHDYFEAVYFIGFGILAIYRNRLTFCYLCSKLTKHNRRKDYMYNDDKIDKKKKLKYSERASIANRKYKENKIKFKMLKKKLFQAIKQENNDRNEYRNSNKYKKMKQYKNKSHYDIGEINY